MVNIFSLLFPVLPLLAMHIEMKVWSEAVAVFREAAWARTGLWKHIQVNLFKETYVWCSCFYLVEAIAMKGNLSLEGLSMCWNFCIVLVLFVFRVVPG